VTQGKARTGSLLVRMHVPSVARTCAPSSRQLRSRMVLPEPSHCGPCTLLKPLS
jgi:hypothetical protein